MDSSNATLTGFVTSKNKDSIIVRGLLIQDGLANVGHHLLTIIAIAFVFTYTPFSMLDRLRSDNTTIKIIFFIIIIFMYIVGLRLIKQLIARIFTVQIVSIRSEHIELILEKLNLNKSDAKELKIIEEVNQGGNRQYRLILKLPDGEVTSKFAFTTYGKAQEIIDLINNSS